jgi:hypothetical protein
MPWLHSVSFDKVLSWNGEIRMVTPEEARVSVTGGYIERGRLLAITLETRFFPYIERLHVE